MSSIAAAHAEAFPWTVREDGVVVLPDEEPSVTRGGIHLPDHAREKPLTGRVVAAGPGKRDGEPAGFSVGDSVLFGRYSGTELSISHGGRKLVLMRFSDVRAWRKA